MARLRVPVICAVIGEGGSGGALGIGVGDRMAVLEHAYYSVISPEGCAAILWKSAEHARTAAKALRFTAKQLKKLDLVDDILPEPLGGAHRDPAATAETLKTYIVDNLTQLKRCKIETILQKRYERVRNLGSFFTAPATASAKTTTAKPRATRSASRSKTAPIAAQSA